MAKTALTVKAARKPKFKVRATLGARAAAGPARSTASSGCAGSASARWRTAASCPASPSPAGRPPRCRTAPPKPVSRGSRINRALPQRPRPHRRSAVETAVRRATGHDDDRPDRRHADPSAKRELGLSRHRDDAVLEDQGAYRRDPPAGGYIQPGASKTPRSARTSWWSSSSGRPVSDRSRPAPGFEARPAGLRKEGQPASSPGRTGHRDHLDVRWPMTDKQARSVELAGKSSPTSGNEGRKHSMSRIGRLPIPYRTVSKSRSTAGMSRSRGRRARFRTPSPSRSRCQGRGRHDRRHPSQRREQGAGAARPVPHADRQHGDGRDPGLLKTLEIVGVGYRVQAKSPTQLEFALGFSHPVIVRRPRGDHLPRREADAVPRGRHRQAEGR